MFDDTARKLSFVVYILNQTNLFLWYFFIRKFYHSDTITAKRSYKKQSVGRRALSYHIIVYAIYGTQSSGNIILISR